MFLRVDPDHHAYQGNRGRENNTDRQKEMSSETARLLNHIAMGLGLLAMVWATIAAGIEKKKSAEFSSQPSGWTESFVQVAIRYLTKRQKIVFVVAMGSAIGLAIVAAVLSR